MKRLGGAILSVLFFWILAAALQIISLFFVGLFCAWLWLWLTNGRNHLPIMYWERLLEPKILLFMSILGVTHGVPGFVVFSAFPSYLWIFLLIAFTHIGAEILVICTRKPHTNKKQPKIAAQKAKRKWYSWS